MHETELVRRAAARDPDAIAALYRAHFEPLRRRCQAITRCPHAAQDAAQDALLATFARLPALDPETTRFGAYATTVARRNAGHRRWLTTPAREDQSEDHAPAVVLRSDVREALSALPPRQRTALFLDAYADSSNGEIAAALGLTPNAAGQLLHRARRALQSSLEAS